MKTFRLLALAAAVSTAAACSDSTGSDNNTGNSGSLSFNYSGARAGSFQASGKYQSTTTSFVKQSFAVGTNTTLFSTPVTVIASYSPVTSSRGDEVLFAFPTASAGATYSLADSCETNCALGFISFNLDPDLETDTSSDDFTFVSGTVTVNSVSGGRVRGSFSGTAEDDDTGTRTLVAVSGSFDVPLVNPGSVGFSKLTPAVTPLQANRIR